MSLALLFRYLLLNMFRMLIHPPSGACDLFVELFHGLYCSGTMCVGVTLWFGWGGVVSGYHSNPITPKLQHTANREQNDRCGNSTAQLQTPDDGYINVRNILST